MDLIISVASSYKKGDRIIINAGTARTPQYWTVTVTSVGGGKWRIKYDDGDKGSVDSARDIVSFANDKKRNTSFGKKELSKYQLASAKGVTKKTSSKKLPKEEPKKQKIEGVPDEVTASLKEGLGHLEEGRATGSLKRTGTPKSLLAPIAKALGVDPTLVKGMRGEVYTFNTKEGKLVVSMNSPSDKTGVYVNFNNKPVKNIHNL